MKKIISSENEGMIDHSSFVHNLSSALPTELSSQLGACHFVRVEMFLLIINFPLHFRALSCPPS